MRLFDTSGYDGTSMDDIAVAAGVSRRSLFRYFPVKAALIWDGFDPFFRVLDGRLESSPIDRDVAERLQLPPRSLEAAALADAATAALFAALRYWAVDTTDETPVNCVHRAMNALAGVFGSR